MPLSCLGIRLLGVCDEFLTSEDRKSTRKHTHLDILRGWLADPTLLLGGARPMSKVHSPMAGSSALIGKVGHDGGISI